MRSLCISLLLLLAPATGLVAQDAGKSDLALSVGLFSKEDIVFDLLLRSFDAIFKNDQKGFGGSPVVTGSYRYFIAERFALGVSLSYKSQADPNTFPGLGGGKWKSWSGGVDSGFYWYKNKKLNLYSSIATGIYSTYTDEQHYAQQSSYTGLAMQISPICVRLGGSTGFFTEFGYGYKGVLNAGLNVRF